MMENSASFKPKLLSACSYLLPLLFVLLYNWPARASMLVDCAWLKTHAHDPTFRIVDVSNHPDSYEQGHIPGAVKVIRHIDLEDYTTYPPVGYPKPAQFQMLMNRLGITPDTTVVAYDDNRGIYASRLFFLMRLYGHSLEKLKILDGGITAWKMAGLPVEKRQPVIKSSGVYTPGRRDSSFLASWQDVYRQVVQHQRPETALLDVRRNVEYSGEVVRCVRGGHIPGAVNLDLAEVVGRDDAGRWKNEGDLMSIFSQMHITLDQPVIIYCHSGDRSAHAFLIMKYLLGFHDVRIYEKAWEEWAVLQALPVSVAD